MCLCLVRAPRGGRENIAKTQLHIDVSGNVHIQKTMDDKKGVIPALTLNRKRSGERPESRELSHELVIPWIPGQARNDPKATQALLGQREVEKEIKN
jgi:hypothetical protein